MSIVQELMQGYDAVLLIDAHQRGGEPGTLRLLEPELPDLSMLDAHGVRDYFADTHCATPLRALAFAQRLGRLPPHVRIIGCEPECYDTMSIGLSASVAAAVGPAVQIALEWMSGVCPVSKESAGAASVDTASNPSQRSGSTSIPGTASRRLRL